MGQAPAPAPVGYRLLYWIIGNATFEESQRRRSVLGDHRGNDDHTPTRRNNSAVVGGLVADKTYEMSVAALSAGGHVGQFSEPVVAITTEDNDVIIGGMALIARGRQSRMATNAVLLPIIDISAPALAFSINIASLDFLTITQ